MEYKLKNGETVIVREAKISDAKALCDYMEIVNVETKNLSREPHEWNMTVEQEEKFIENSLSSNNNYHAVMLLNDEIISAAGFHGSSLMRLTHSVSLGISVLLKYQGLGAGSIMMDHLIEIAKKYHKKRMELEVRSDNEVAIMLYEKKGFKLEGQKRASFYVDDKYVDLVQMGLLFGEEDE